MTVLEIIQKSTDFLGTKGVELPRLQSESILAHVLSMPRMQLYLNFERQLSEDQISACRELVRLRGTRQPLQHLLGSVSFCGLDIRVSRQALIPRPETEQLVEHAQDFVNRLTSPAPAILDFGTGSGCICVALALRCPTASFVALDISPDALELAKLNAGDHGVQNRIHFALGDGFSALPRVPPFDLIVANPPYIPSAEIETLQPEVKDHDPRIALDGGGDGLDFYRLLGATAPAHLTPGGGLIVEFGDGQGAAIAEMMTGENWIVGPPRPDYSGRDRFLIVRRSG